MQWNIFWFFFVLLKYNGNKNNNTHAFSDGVCAFDVQFAKLSGVSRWHPLSSAPTKILPKQLEHPHKLQSPTLPKMHIPTQQRSPMFVMWGWVDACDSTLILHSMFKPSMQKLWTIGDKQLYQLWSGHVSSRWRLLAMQYNKLFPM